MLTGFCFLAGNIFAQEVLPDFTVKNSNGKISVSWQNKYPVTVKGISIQRSYDSVKNFSTVTTVTNPNDAVNGFMDLHAPYEKMYYRLFIAFDSGAYIFTSAYNPDVDPDFNLSNALRKIREENRPKPEAPITTAKPVKQFPPAQKTKTGEVQQNSKPENQTVQQSKEVEVVPVPKKEEIPYPSQRIYTGKDNNVVINLADFEPGKYSVKFFDEENKPLFVLNKITEGYFIIEKVNFFHAGWFFFELYEDDTLLEKNKFYIQKD